MNASAKILIVGKDEKTQKSLAQFLTRVNYPWQKTRSFTEARERLQRSGTFAVVLVHLDTHEGQILNALRRIRPAQSRAGFVLLSKLPSPDLAISLLQEGVVDYVTHPTDLAGIYAAVRSEFNKRELIAANESYMESLRMFKIERQKHLKKVLDMEEIHDSTLDNLMTALDLRDVETLGHSRTVAKYSQVLAQILGFKDEDALSNIRKGALLHDVGKIAIPDSILKKPSSLSSQEWKKIKLHPTLGYGLIKDIKLVKEVGNIILCHHERYDGTGYPQQLGKEKIPIEARIFSLADALDAITSHRPYRKRRTFEDARKEIVGNKKFQFDPQVVEAFCSLDIAKWERIRFETTKLIPIFEDMIEES